MFNVQLKALFVVAIAFCALGSVAVAQPMLTVDDCAKCHAQQPAEIAANGASHQTEIDCQACHEGHRPSSENNIPNCNDCHEGSAHYEVENCLGCHNPHEPLNVQLEGEHKAVCNTCHTEPNAQLEAQPSKHTTFACNFCHEGGHPSVPSCTDCHEPHSESMTQQNCATCHLPHKPLELMYPANTASQLCASCHDSVMATLTASKAKHSQVACVSCHADKHKTIPQCNDCHGMPHAEAMHQRFPKCGECHNIAHDLNNWPAK